ncbi:hypothetical protein BDR05DRAFT_1018874, partial [Suillus weaverae]
STKLVLDPTSKLAYFKKHWPSNLLNDVLACVENVFEQCYNELHQSLTLLQPATTKSKVGGLKKLIQEVQSNLEDDSEAEPGAMSIRNPSKPWRAEFTNYIETIEAAPLAGMTTIWWGINTLRYPVWALLTRDYLSIMAASVSSE